MSAFPTTTPPDVTEIRDYIRFWLGDLSESYISDDAMNVFITMNIDKYGDNLCKITFYSTIDILRWLIREGAKGSSGTGASGALKSIEEESGKRRIKKTYETSGEGAVESGWQSVLDDLLENPSTIGCNPIDASTDSGATGSVVIGGVSHREAERVNNDPDTRNGYNENPRDTLNRYPSYRRTTRNPFGYN